MGEVMDQESFERGLSLGLSVALVCIERDPRNPYAAVKLYSDQMQGALDERWNGKREMIAADILLPMPMMQAADLALSPTPRPEGRRVRASA